MNQQYRGNSRDSRSNPPFSKSRNDSTSYRLEPSSRIKEPLAQYYSDPAHYLMGGTVYKIAVELRTLSNSQLRKVLGVAKQAVSIIKSNPLNIEEAKMVLFSLLPLTSYNFSRESKKGKEVYFKLLSLLYQNVNEATIASAQDVKTFDRLITDIVAYHKLIGGKG